MTRRLRLRIRGSVQGVGFRPFVYRVARELGLCGWVNNDPQGVTVEAQGDESRLETLARRLADEHPRAALPESVDRQWCETAPDERGFRILASGTGGARTVQVLPDIATCADCARELRDPGDRRHGYAFINCTACGPRFSIVLSLPYDRPRTTMSRFTMCEACRREYEDPLDRRFHAQPNACAECGPRVALWEADGAVSATDAAAIGVACDALCSGEVIAVKGLGGFHLMADAGDGEAIERLRSAKPRREKPFALMVRDVEQAGRLCRLDPAAVAVLEGPEAPIVLLERLPEAAVDPGVAPNNPYLGVMLPYAPLHHLLLERLGRPVVATSGNLSDEPICTDEDEARRRLRGAADRFLVHDRPIARHVDDSVAWIDGDRPRLLRRARGFAPRPVLVDRSLPVMLALGAHLKNAVALSVDHRVFVSQHIGDMETPESLDAFERVIADFLALYEARPVAVAHDLHPEYPSTGWARRAAAGELTDTAVAETLRGLPLVAAQHHHAHLASCMLEHGVDGPALGAIWDGTGYGTDGAVWGGEFLLGDAVGFERVAHLRPFRLPGGDAAMREPRRSALALLWECFGEAALEMTGLAPVRALRQREIAPLTAMLARGVRSPRTTSMGRLFDGIAALVGLRQSCSFEGQAAMELEFVADRAVRDAYPLPLERPPAGEPRPLQLDWRPLVEAVLSDLDRGTEPATISARFHNALIEAVPRVARRVGCETVVLSGGCFQNRRLAVGAAGRLRRAGLEPLLPSRVPPNDGGISLGQLAIAAARLNAEDGSPHGRSSLV